MRDQTRGPWMTQARQRLGRLGVGVLLIVTSGVVVQRLMPPGAVDGIGCAHVGQTRAPLHQHLAILDHGHPIVIPGDVGRTAGILTAPCLRWLHTHTTDGIIHVEVPARTHYTLGQFFALWQQPLSRTRLLSFRAARGSAIRAFVNGRRFSGDPQTIPLTQHAAIMLEGGPPWRTPRHYVFPSGT